MNLSIHFFISLIISFILFPFFSYYSFLMMIGGFLIDFDHYLEYIITKRDLNIRRAYWFHKNKEDMKTLRLNIFHTVEFWAIILTLSFYSNIIMIITIGVISHMIMDALNNMGSSTKMPRSFSLIYWIIKRKK